MTQSAFDAAGFVRFDLATGSIQSSLKEPMALVPLDLIANLNPDPPLLASAAAWGKTLGQNLLTSLDEDLDEAGMDSLATHIGGAVATMGLGKVVIDIYGDALFFKVSAPTSITMTPALAAIISGFLEGFLTAITPNTSFKVVNIDDENENDSVFFAGNPHTVTKIKALTQDGRTALEAVALLTNAGGQV